MKLSRLRIRTRITGGSLLIAMLISLVAGILIFSQVRRIVNDDQLTVLSNIEAPYLSALATAAKGDVVPPGPGQLVAVVDPSGSVLVDTLPIRLSELRSDLEEYRGSTTTVAAGGSSYLVRVTEVSGRTGAWLVISAVNDNAQVSVLNQVALLLIVSIAGINLSFGASSWLIGSAALSPVARLRRSASELVREPGDELLPVDPAQDEISDLARTLNELIGQLRASADRERQIVSDASHEFRTPLAILRTQLELAQTEASSLEQMQEDVAAAQRTLARLITLSTSMLELSRIDAQASPGHSTLAELAAELADAVDRGRQRVAGRDISIEFDEEVAEGDPRLVAVAVSDFGRVCDNLVNNALAALGERGLVELAIRVENGLVLTVTDDGGGMSEAFVPHAFDRFSRGETAHPGSGAGLGLAIVNAIATVSGGIVRLHNRPGVGLTVEVDLPFVTRPTPSSG